jgi:hypothetical protein
MSFFIAVNPRYNLYAEAMEASWFVPDGNLIAL